MKQKNLELERLVFFSDAVIAIAITLLALDLKIERKVIDHLQFSDVFSSWEKFSAFGLTFLIIAIFWKVHHEFFYYIKKIDNKLLWYNILWLLFIVILPFSTSLVSAHFRDTAAICTYSVNVLMITIFQNAIWDYASERKEYLREEIEEEVIYNFRFGCNIAMINAVIGIVISFFSPIAAFIILSLRLPTMLVMRRFSKRSPLRKKR